MNAISWSKHFWWLAVLCAMVLVGCLTHAAGFRINPTPSMPKGLYRLVERSPAKGDLVTFCLQGEFAFLAQERGYVQAGSCLNGLRPLLKRLAGLPGDYIEANALAIRSVDSQGRHMPSVLQSGVIPSGMAFVLADHAGSFDSRYFGFVPLESLQRVEPVFIFNLGEKGN